MKVDEKLVNELADLAKLEFNLEGKIEIINDLNRILVLIDKLNMLDTTNVEPLVYLTEETNVLREDEVYQDVSKREVLKNAPKSDSDYFKVPKVIEKN